MKKQQKIFQNKNNFSYKNDLNYLIIYNQFYILFKKIFILYRNKHHLNIINYNKISDINALEKVNFKKLNTLNLTMNKYQI